MSHIHRSALVPFSAQQMFELINDVEAYPRRFDWCESASVSERSDAALLAHLNVKLGALKASFSTRNSLTPFTRIDMALADGPFHALSGGWAFLALGERGCKISLTLDFEIAGRWIGSALAIGFQRLADNMVDDFVREAKLAYV